MKLRIELDFDKEEFNPSDISVSISSFAKFLAKSNYWPITGSVSDKFGNRIGRYSVFNERSEHSLKEAIINYDKAFNARYN